MLFVYMIIFLLFDYFSSISPLPFLLPPPPAHASRPSSPPHPTPLIPQLMQFCDLCYVDTQTSDFVGLGINVFPVYVNIIFVYRVVYVDMSTHSSQLNHLNLDLPACS